MLRMQTKANANDFSGRFREIVSDPLNLLIQRDPCAGFVNGDCVFLHNGLRVPLFGPYAYYEQFSQILVINRGVHEPLEEFVFQEVVKRLPSTPIMLELGAYWGHYSMWLKLARPDASVHLVEPELHNLNAGRNNFELNGFSGEFLQAFVGKDSFRVDQYLGEKSVQKLTILHSDVQGYEMEMMDGCTKSLEGGLIDYLFISTHSQSLHFEVIKMLEGLRYRVEVSSDFDHSTTSYDGFIFASSYAVEAIFKSFTPMARFEIARSNPGALVDYLSNIMLAK